MGKYDKQIETLPTVKTPSLCAHCGWRFEIDNNTLRGFDSDDDARMRKEPRSEIAVRQRGGGYLSLCTDCYEKDLWKDGAHSKQKHDKGELYRQALFKLGTTTERSGPTEISKLLSDFGKRL